MASKVSILLVRSASCFWFGLLFFVLLVFFRFFLFPFFFVVPEFGVGAGVGMEFFVVDFDDSCCEFVEEVAVVGNDDERAFVIA